MIDTLEMFTELDKHHIEHLVEGLGIATNALGTETSKYYEGFHMKAFVPKEVYRPALVFVFINVPKLLGRGNVNEADRLRVEEKIEDAMVMFFGDRTLAKEVRLKRIDFRLDCVVESEELRMQYIRLLDRAKPKMRRLEKLGSPDKTGKVQSKYKTSIVHEAKSVETIVYCKESERNAKNRELATWEEKVLRYEIKLLKNHIDYKKSKGMSPRLESYWKQSVYKQYLIDYLVKMYFQGDYYSLESAKTKISRSNFTSSKKEKLIQFLKTVSNGNIDTPKKTLSPTTYRARLMGLDELEVNPVTIRHAELKMGSCLKNLLNEAIININVAN